MGSQVITGLDIGSTGVSWTSLRVRKKKRTEVADQNTRELGTGEKDAVQPDYASEAFCVSLKKAIHGVEGDVCVGLPASKMLLRVAELPSTDPDELQGMVELQVDKFCPFSMDRTCFSYEVLHQRENATRVLIAAVPRQVVDEVGEAFRACGIIPYRLDSRLMGWWVLLRENASLSEHGQQSILVVEEHEVSLIVMHHGLPVVFRSIGSHEEYTTAEEVDELLDEIDFTLTTLEAEWESAEDMKMSVWSRGELPPLLKSRLEEDAVHGAVFNRFEELPPLSEGLARRGLRSESRRLNLAPVEWAGNEHYRRVLRRLITFFAVFLAFWLVTIVSIAVYLNVQQGRLAQLQAGQPELQEAVQEVRRIKDKVQSLRQFADRTHSALESLREVSLLLPDGVELTQFNYKKGEDINLKGSAKQAGPIHDFVAALEDSGLFVQVTPDNIVSKRRRDNALQTEFTITLVLPGGEE
jgi:Tfp pilus assembly protein PilN